MNNEQGRCLSIQGLALSLVELNRWWIFKNFIYVKGQCVRYFASSVRLDDRARAVPSQTLTFSEGFMSLILLCSIHLIDAMLVPSGHLSSKAGPERIVNSQCLVV